MKRRKAVAEPSCSRRGAVVQPSSSRRGAVVEPSSSRRVAVVGPSCSRHGGRHPVGQVEQLALLWLPGDEAADQAPDWLTGGETPAQRTNAIRGLHPTGRALGRGTNRCTACRHRVKFDGYSKCALDQHRWTNARGTDIRARWRECSEWMEA